MKSVVIGVHCVNPEWGAEALEQSLRVYEDGSFEFTNYDIEEDEVIDQMGGGVSPCLNFARDIEDPEDMIVILLDNDALGEEDFIGLVIDSVTHCAGRLKSYSEHFVYGITSVLTAVQSYYLDPTDLAELAVFEKREELAGIVDEMEEDEESWEFLLLNQARDLNEYVVEFAYHVVNDSFFDANAEDDFTRYVLWTCLTAAGVIEQSLYYVQHGFTNQAQEVAWERREKAIYDESIWQIGRLVYYLSKRGL